jgi:3',5'-cyclic AMP phosphodiesterase CpdA
LHFGGEDEAALAAVAGFVERTRPEVVVATGDLALSGERAELEVACAWLRALPAPVVVTPGNHDVPYYSLLGRLFDPFRRYRDAAHGVETHAWRNQNYAIITANTARGVQIRANWAQGAISEAQVEAVGAFAAKERDSGRLVVLATHHPLAWPNDAPIIGRTWGGREAERVLVQRGIDVFLSGHLHVASARAVGVGDAVAVCGGTLSKRVRHEPCAFTTVDTADGELEVGLYHVVDGVAERASLRRFPLTAHAAQGEQNARLGGSSS